MTNANKIDGLFSLTAPAVMTFADLLEPKAFKRNGKEQGDPKYSARLVFDANHPDVLAMKELVTKIARSRWPDKPFSELAFPFVSGDKLADKAKTKGKDTAEWLRGKVVVTPKSKLAPRLAYIDGGKIIDLETDTAIHAAKGKFYNGVEVLVQMNFGAYDPIGEQAKGGVTSYLNMVISTNKGQRRTGGASPSDVFRNYRGGVSAEDPTGGEDDSLDDVMGM